jgi:hypothetical protein
VRLHAFAYGGSPPQTLTLIANGPADSTRGAECAALPVPADWQTIECTLDEAMWRTGVNHLQLRFAYAARPMDVGAGGDARALAAAVDWVRVSVK